MKYREETRAERDWDGEFEMYDMMNGQDLGHSLRTGAQLFSMRWVGCNTQQDSARTDIPVTFFWNTSET